MYRVIRASSEGDQEYVFYTVDNAAVSTRGKQLNKYHQDHEFFSTVEDAMAYGAAITLGMNSLDEYLREGFKLNEAKSILDNQDLGAGYPVVYAIRTRFRDFIYKHDYFDQLEHQRDTSGKSFSI